MKGLHAMRRAIGVALVCSLALAGAAWGQVSSPPSLPALHWTGQATLAVTATTGNVALATTVASSPRATTAVITNSGTKLAYVKFGVGNTTAVTTANGYPVLPGAVVVLPIGSGTYIAGICGGTDTTTLGISTGW